MTVQDVKHLAGDHRILYYSILEVNTYMKDEPTGPPPSVVDSRPLPSTKHVQDVLDYLNGRKETFAKDDTLFEFLISVHSGIMHGAAETLGGHWNGSYNLGHIRLLFAVFAQLKREQQHEIEARRERGA